MSAAAIPPFYAEEYIWALTHCLIPAAFYIAVRRLDWAVLGVYIFETLEIVAAVVFADLGETGWDSLVGDIIHGVMAILILWYIDMRTGAHILFRERVPVWVRIVAFALTALSVLLNLVACTDTANFGALIFYTAYVAIALFFYGRVIFWVRPDRPDDLVLGQTLILWLAGSAIYVIAALPNTTGRVDPLLSLWMRMFYISAVLLLLAFAYYALQGNWLWWKSRRE